jgi:Holliday junction resolvasome RuvABC endonuclease subunit
MRVYLGIDQSIRSSGFAAVNEHGKYVSSYTVSVGDALRGAARLTESVRQFNAWVDPLWKIVGIAQEGYSVNSTNRPFDLGSVFGALQVAAFMRSGLEPLIVPPKSLKLFVTGNGAADKDEILYTVKTQWNIDLDDRDDEADAFGLARLSWALDTKRFSRKEIPPSHNYRELYC